MQLLQARLVNVGPLADVDLSFSDEAGDPRPVTVIHGGGGVGKTTLLQALSMTRPGHAVAGLPVSNSGSPPRAACQYFLGQDDSERPHGLWVATPMSRVFEDDEREALRRREQTLFDRVAREGGFAYLALPASRWFSRQPLVLAAPARTLARYDVRAGMTLDEGSRSDLARETKQALCYASLVGALASSEQPGRGRRFAALATAMVRAVNHVVSLAGFEHIGLDPLSLEPRFLARDGSTVLFDMLPTRARHLVAFAALPVRTLWAAHPARDPSDAEGIVTIDEVDLCQDPVVQSCLIEALKRALPAVQWIVTTTSPVVAASCDTHEVVALRKDAAAGRVALFTDAAARTH